MIVSCIAVPPSAAKISREDPTKLYDSMKKLGEGYAVRGVPSLP